MGVRKLVPSGAVFVSTTGADADFVAKLVAVHRDLRTLVTDIATTETLAADVPPDRFLISESGIRSNADIKRLVTIGSHGFLVGEHLMRQQDVAAATRELLGKS